MQKFLFVLACCFLSTDVWAQKMTTTVPLQVSQQFSHRFGKIQEVEWNASGKEQYQAAFYHNGVRKTAIFSNSGQWLAVENLVSEREIPLKVNQSLAKEFPGYQVSEVTKMELFGKNTSFRIRVRKGGGIFDVEIDVNGQVRRREEVYRDRDRDENEYCHHHDDCHHDSKHHHKKHKHKHKHGKGHGHHNHDGDDD